MAEIQIYQDPLILLLKDPGLNKDKEKSSKLLSLIRGIPQEQVKLKQSCLDGFQILRDLERIGLRSSTWHKASLNFQIVSRGVHMSPEEFKKRQLNSQLATQILQSCLDLRRLLIDISEEVEDLNEYVSSLSPLQCISDPGTILCELSFRIIRLKNKLEEEISVTYSKAKLITIGKELEDHLFLYDDSHPLSEETVEKYTSFVNQLLKQLNDCVSQNDTIGTMECVAVVNDVEKMFEAMQFKRRVLELKSPTNSFMENSETLGNSSTYDSDDDFRTHSTMSSISSLEGSYNMAKPSSRPTSRLSAELPGLMSAFKSPQPLSIGERFSPSQTLNLPAAFSAFSPIKGPTFKNVKETGVVPQSVTKPNQSISQPPTQTLAPYPFLKSNSSLWGQSLLKPPKGGISEDKSAKEFILHDIDNLID
ncbi:unnamed protein product [Kuraishia capsulata CBS 1993]|uniref:Uncharacterized protein n=1 Tax=Kuraishia capsulata CBS 1993 TaxID=1382522 RepID=W6MNZ1_9ASCO|nr:uncharacterized protein KUCA_T00004371001 [Kuraishia capsulata CBS 1993]CDK28389.1 unnamed protein product [Kuraishia capsulata CBS 1993]